VVDPKEVVGVVENDEPDDVAAFSAPDEISRAIGSHVARFLSAETSAGGIPRIFLPLQAGVGNVANGVMQVLGGLSRIRPFKMYSEVFQDSQVELKTSGRLPGASAAGLNLTADKMKQIVSDIDYFAPRIVLRPQEISNNPVVIRRLGVIALNTALEFDIYGTVSAAAANLPATAICPFLWPKER